MKKSGLLYRMTAKIKKIKKLMHVENLMQDLAQKKKKKNQGCINKRKGENLVKKVPLGTSG